MPSQMPIAELLLPEFDHETATTRVLLERVPEASADWAPHARSRSLGQLAMHIANIPIWASITLERREFDTNPPEGPAIVTPPFESSRQLLRTYDVNVQAARALLVRTTDGEFLVQWTLKNAGKNHGAGTTAKALADLTAAGQLVNPKDKKGYRLREWRKKNYTPSLFD